VLRCRSAVGGGRGVVAADVRLFDGVGHLVYDGLGVGDGVVVEVQSPEAHGRRPAGDGLGDALAGEVRGGDLPLREFGLERATTRFDLVGRVVDHRRRDPHLVSVLVDVDQSVLDGVGEVPDSASRLDPRLDRLPGVRPRADNGLGPDPLLDQSAYRSRP
jgi:hypothetical protein